MHPCVGAHKHTWTYAHTYAYISEPPKLHSFDNNMLVDNDASGLICGNMMDVYKLTNASMFVSLSLLTGLQLILLIGVIYKQK